METISDEPETRRTWAVGRVDRRSSELRLADSEEAPIEGPFRMKAVVRSSEPSGAESEPLERGRPEGPREPAGEADSDALPPPPERPVDPS